MNIPRKEHPKPQFERADWQNLNGPWQFEIDNGKSGVARELFKDEVKLSDEIIVPFCPESKLSGVIHKDFMYGVWYKRSFTVDNKKLNGRTFIHFGAVDYSAEVYINEKKVGTHKGGYVSFKFEITDYIKAGVNTVAVFAADDTRDHFIPSGKQCAEYNSTGCYYTRTTGIWQTVWLEFTPREYVEWVKYFPNIKQNQIVLEVCLNGNAPLSAEVSFDGKPMGRADVAAKNGITRISVDLKEKHLWDIGCGNLYDVEITFGKDRVQSYFGLREIAFDGDRFMLNGRSVFQRLVLDQGFYPDGIYTAPTDEDLKKDIELSLSCGFNGARLHEKIFEERYLYYCDKAGYLAWGEYPGWGVDHSSAEAVYAILPEWIEEINRDFNHPSIIGWCPMNETWPFEDRMQKDDVLRLIYRTTKAIDPERPCIDSSGWFHVETDIFDVHDYNQDPADFKKKYDTIMETGEIYDWTNEVNHFNRQKHKGEPAFVSEYGGIQWTDFKEAWGYGNEPKSLDEFYERFKGLTDALLDNTKMFALCYTQLTDVEQERNGLFNYDRSPKFDAAKLKEIMSRKAAIED